MRSTYELSHSLRSLRFQLEDVLYIRHHSNCTFERVECELHSLFVFREGTGGLLIESKPFIYTTGKCYIVPPGTSLCMTSDGASSVSYYHITFRIEQWKTNDIIEVYPSPLFPGQYELSVYPWSRFLRSIEEIYANRDEKSDIDWFNQQVLFMQLMSTIFEHNLRLGKAPSPTQSVEQTIQYINQHYSENITVKQLAQLANVTSWRYTPMFQELTGKKPIDYVTDVRINKAKELLQSSDEPLREIALSVGFTDEYYFNRRFRQVVGITPKQYARLMRGSVTVTDWTGHVVEIPLHPKRLIYHGETFGDLIALGVEAVGTSSTFMKGSIYEDLLNHIEDVGHPFDQEKTRRLAPDLIIIANEEEELYRAIAGIAPAVTFNSFAPLEERLLTLGELLGKQLEAKQWLEAFQRKEQDMWNELRPWIQPNETATVFIYDRGERLFVMGSIGMSAALYHRDGFKAVDRVQPLLESGNGYLEIEEEELPLYAGDRIFLLLGQHEQSRQAAKRMMQSASWLNLPAVQKGHVHHIPALHWNLNDALTRERLLHELPQLISKKAGMEA
ncbi:helix-turn-helix domain-containing protein [Paenibacillus aquistagni]|uniref:helix-turn-helix domain-containing protein n=1 Tax=Paenibacillus aquistagni TaxID=1852522 RepID=UPI000B50DB50|nr:AraC family transcriptional regulator [Paenibacillus aquistagni]